MGNQPATQSYFDTATPFSQYGELVLREGSLFTVRTVRELMQQFQRPFTAGGCTLEPASTIRLLALMSEELKKNSVGLDLSIPEGTTLTIVGDLHGQLFDLLKIFTLNGEPSATNRYLFDGDFVDRGKFGAEVFLVLSAWKVLYPEYVHLLRGNHEVATINEYYGFDEELRLKYPSDSNMRARFNQVFAVLPVWAIVEEKIFVVHGGLPKQAERTTTSDLHTLRKVTEPLQESQLQDLLWSDPQEPDGYEMSERGAGVMWGPDITDHFIANNNLEMIIRAHQMCADGFKMQHKGKVLTVFSSPNYCGRCGNRAAIVKIRPDRGMTIHTFVAANTTASEMRAMETVPAKLPVTHVVGSVLHHTPENPFFVSGEEVEVEPVLHGHSPSSGATDTSFSTDGTMLCSVSAKESTLQIWEQSEAGFENVLSLRLTKKPHKVSWTNDLIAVGCLDGSIMVFSAEAVLQTGKQIKGWNQRIQEMEGEFASEFFPMQNEYDAAVDARKRELNSKFIQLQQQRKQSQVEMKAQISGLMSAASADAASYKAHEDAVNQLRWSRDGTMLASCSRDRSLILWRCVEQESPSPPEGGSEAPEDDAVPVMAEPKLVLMPITSIPCNIPLADLSWRGSDHVLATAGGPDGKIRVFDVTDAKPGPTANYEIANFPTSPSNPLPVYAVAYNSSGTVLAVAGKDEAILLYDAEYKLIERLERTHNCGVTHLSFSDDDLVLASAGLDQCVRLWNVNEALQLKDDLLKLQTMMQKVSIESTSEETASWRQQMVELNRAVQKAVLLGLGDRPHGLSWKPTEDGALYSLACAADGDMPVGVWDFPTLRKIANI